MGASRLESKRFGNRINTGDAVQSSNADQSARVDNRDVWVALGEEGLWYLSDTARLFIAQFAKPEKSNDPFALVAKTLDNLRWVQDWEARRICHECAAPI